MVASDGMNDVPVWQIWRRQRYVVTALTFLGFFNLYTLRVNVSVAIVEMTGNKSQVLENGTVIQSPPEYPWDSSTQGLVLSAFFYGYITTQLLGGWLALKVGGNLLLAVSVAASAVLSIVTPWVVDFSVYGFIAIRAIQGIFQGVSYPASQELWSRWAPPAERSWLANLGYAGCDAGAVVGLTASGAIIAAVGWRAVFFIFGGVGLAWVVVSLLLVKRSPAEDRLIDTRECHYIQQCLGGPPEKQVGPYPWTSFLTSMPVWAILVANFTENWGYYTLLTELPMFMKETLNFDIEQTGFLSSLPSVLTVIIMPLAGWLSDWLINKGYLSIIQCKSFGHSTTIC